MTASKLKKANHSWYDSTLHRYYRYDGLLAGTRTPFFRFAIVTLLIVMIVAIIGIRYLHHRIPTSAIDDPYLRQHRNFSVYIMMQSFCSRNSTYDSVLPAKSNTWWKESSSNRVSLSQVIPEIQHGITCHPSMNINMTQTSTTTLTHHSVRTLVAHTASIPAYQTIIRISKEFTIWDIDAIQDPWIQQNVILPQQQLLLLENHSNGSTPTETRTGKNVPAAAYLSIYMTRLMFHHHPLVVSDMEQTVYKLRNAYVATLSRHVDEFQDHPIFWSDDDLQRMLGTQTVAYHSVRHFQKMIQHEYDVVSSIILQQEEIPIATSTNTDIPLSYDQYRIARVSVLSRSFGTGPIPLSLDAVLQERVGTIHTHLPRLKFTNGHHVMVPILDQLNHHGQDYNVDFSYHVKNQSFIAHSNTVIPMGHEIIDHYGKHTLSHLFAKYGFINYDSSDYNEATIALWHDLHYPYDGDDDVELSTRLSDQEERKYQMQMLRYLQYDDGYESCIGDPHIVRTTDGVDHDPQQQQYFVGARARQALALHLHISGERPVRR